MTYGVWKDILMRTLVATLLSRKRKTGSIRIRLDYSNFEIRIIAKNNRISNFEFESNLSPNYYTLCTHANMPDV